MKLSKRATLLILPVLLASYLLAGAGVYMVQKQAIYQHTQSRLELSMAELSASLASYISFSESYLLSTSSSEVMLYFLTEPDNHYRSLTLSAQMEDYLRRFQRHHSDYLAFALVPDSGHTEYYFESSQDPFAEPSPALLAFARSLRQQQKLMDWTLTTEPDGRTRIIQGLRLDRRTASEPLPTQQEQTITAAIVIEPTEFDRLRLKLEHSMQAGVMFSPQPPVLSGPLTASAPVGNNLYLGIDPSPDVVQDELRQLQESLLVGLMLLAVCSTLLLLWLIRHYITQPISHLEQDLHQVISGEQSQLSDIRDDNEIGRLGQTFQSLYIQLSHAYKQTRQQAIIDPLTGLPNRMAFSEQIVQALQQAGQHHHQLSLLSMNLDNFKYINDKYGHEFGDQLLQAIALQVGKTLLHPESPASMIHTPLLVRLAGDEFALLLEHSAGSDLIYQQTTVIQNLFKEGFTFELGCYPITMGIGVATYPEDGNSASELVANAEVAMYQAKAIGKNQVAFYSRNLAMKIRRAKDIEQELKVLVEDQEFQLVYMPIVDGKTGVTVCCEALLRWNSPVLGRVPPDEFIPIAENCGLYDKIDHWVVERAFRDFSKLQGCFGKQTRIAINLSSAELGMPGVDKFLLEMANRYRLSTQYIEIEITETYKAEYSLAADALLKRLRAAGFTIVIDDFGTGYTSLLQMLEYPVDKVKLDRSFLERLLNTQQGELLQPLIALCQLQGIRVVAEGVENQAQADMLTAAGCDYLQGYWFGKPKFLDELSQTTNVKPIELAKFRRRYQ
ncbi:putative bifunctional diguanylate cyclase/phosphodiesterase [Zobellella maritima]|uniref:putative bifunctional diguanylate cyclase/phosphodiesterase n=1 Tax=Zobellella maritima TaxID=2059725 RepID=UPI000E301309|nr:GGDEF domain-containing phosphodiesterase [Zobellella maritima]